MNNKKTISVLVFFGAISCAPTVVSAQSPNGSQSTDRMQSQSNDRTQSQSHDRMQSQSTDRTQSTDRAKSTARSTDQSFTREAASGGMAEVKLGQLAQTKGSAQSVKDFGKRMEADHSKASDQLKDAASKDNITLPSTMPKSDEAIYQRLSKLSGAEFDKAYAEQMVKDHKKDIASFQKEATKGKKPEIKQFASQTLPTLQEHLKMAQAMQNTVSGANQSASGAPATR